MRHTRTAEDIGTIHIDIAARTAKPSATPGGIDGTHLLHMARTRDVPPPEPVTWRDLNGREPQDWEEPAIIAGRQRERGIESRLLAGTSTTEGGQQ